MQNILVYLSQLISLIDQHPRGKASVRLFDELLLFAKAGDVSPANLGEHKALYLYLEIALLSALFPTRQSLGEINPNF